MVHQNTDRNDRHPLMSRTRHLGLYCSTSELLNAWHTFVQDEKPRKQEPCLTGEVDGHND